MESEVPPDAPPLGGSAHAAALTRIARCSAEAQKLAAKAGLEFKETGVISTLTAALLEAIAAELGRECVLLRA